MFYVPMLNVEISTSFELFLQVFNKTRKGKLPVMLSYTSRSIFTLEEPSQKVVCSGSMVS